MTIDAYVTDYEGAWEAALPSLSIDHITDVLNGPQVMDCTIGQSAPGALAISGWDKEIQVRELDQEEETNEVVFQGPVVSEDGDENTAKFSVEGVLAHLGTRLVDRTSLLYTSIEQRAIALALIEYAQDESVQGNRDLNITSAPFSGTTHVRSRNYLREEHPFILDLLKEFPTLDDGFDFDIQIQPDGARWWTPYYPKKGVTHTDFELEFTAEGSGNIVGFRYRRDYKRLLTQAYVTGGTNGDVKFEQNYEDPLFSALWGVRQDVLSEGSQLDVGWLLSRGIREVGQRRQPIFVPEITLSRYPVDWKKIIKVGDYVPLKISRGRASIIGYRRVLERKWNIEANTISLTVAEVP